MAVSSRKPDAADDADGDRQHQELHGVLAAGVARDRHQVQHLRQQVLAADDVEQHGDGHHGDTQHHAPEIERRSAEERHPQREADAHGEAHQEHRHRERQARTHPLADLGADIALVLGGAEIEHEQADGLLVEDGFGQLLQSGRFFIDQQGLVVSPFRLPFVDRLGSHALGAELHARHVVGRVDDEEQRKRKEVHADQDGHGVQHASDDVGEHLDCGPGRHAFAPAVEPDCRDDAGEKQEEQQT